MLSKILNNQCESVRFLSTSEVKLWFSFPTQINGTKLLFPLEGFRRPRTFGRHRRGEILEPINPFTCAQWRGVVEKPPHPAFYRRSDSSGPHPVDEGHVVHPF